MYDSRCSRGALYSLPESVMLAPSAPLLAGDLRSVMCSLMTCSVSLRTWLSALVLSLPNEDRPGLDGGGGLLANDSLLTALSGSVTGVGSCGWTEGVYAGGAAGGVSGRASGAATGWGGEGTVSVTVGRGFEVAGRLGAGTFLGGGRV
jgi:hypothetical protein